MDISERSSRKRRSTDSSSAESPKSKKRKRTTDAKVSPLTTHTTSTPITPPSKVSPLTTHTTSTPITPPSKKSSKRSKQSATLTDQEQSLIEPEQTNTTTSKKSSKKKASKPDEGTSTSGTRGKGGRKGSKKGVAMETMSESPISHSDPPAKHKNKRRVFYLKPVNGSWTKQIGSLVIYRCVSQAMLQSIDPREHMDDINWSVLAGGGFISSKDVKLIWYLIKKEYPDLSLTAIRDELKPYTTLTVEEFTRADIKDKYKDEIPKAPPTPYMLFVQSKGPALKAKHPELVQTSIAKKLGKKWQSMGAEKQDKYRQQYQQLKKEYDSKMELFYSVHPDAKAPGRLRKQGGDDSQLTQEEKRIKELKSLLPKTPLSSYMLFCQAKRSKLQRKHQELKPKEITLKLSKKWKTMIGPEQAKYKQIYEDSSRLYKDQMKVFHETYPDAKELLARTKKTKDTSAASISTQTSILVTPKKATPTSQTQQDNDETDISSSDESKVGVAKEGDVDSDEDSETDMYSSNESPPLINPAKSTGSINNTSKSSHDQSHDGSSSSDDDDTSSGFDTD